MNRIKELREEKGLTLRQLSKEVGIPASTLSRYEQTGKTSRKPKFDNLFKLAEFFNVNVGYISGFSDTRKDGTYLYNGKIYIDFDHLEKEKNATEKVNEELFCDIYNLLNDRLFEKYKREENEKIINSIDDISTKKETVKLLTRFIETSLQALNNNRRAKKTMYAIKGLINNYHYNAYNDDEVIADFIISELNKDN